MEGLTPTILVVEDDPLTRTFLADNLTADGYNLVETGSAGEAARLLQTAFPDVAIVDLGLPDQDGLELLRLVRESDPVAGRIDPELPLLVLSGRVSELERLRGFERGCDDYMGKPFSYQELRALISSTAECRRFSDFKSRSLGCRLPPGTLWQGRGRS
ncbi:MAG TPA: response regulator transcription factor [Solirubrobacteraceae bacterium]|nr:response regulator transcription factor [Solirubrobacteraceae bacterium]